MQQQDSRTAVLIVGAGPVGLALAIELGHRAVPCIVIERNDRVGHAPRAKTTNVRTREHLRRWGIADALGRASPLGLDYPSHVTFVTRLGGQRLGRIENAMYCAPGKNPLYSEHAQWIPQSAVEQVMKAHAQSLPGVEFRFGTELGRFEQDADGVHALARTLDGGAEARIRADYLVGADGARSAVRSAIGANMQGQYGLSRNYNIVFRSPGLAQMHAHGPAIMYWQINPDQPSLIGPMDSDERWFFMPTQLAQGVAFAPADAPALIRRATGLPAMAVDVLSADEWVASRLIADRYRERRVFLAGDACHLHPPFGGYGMNMGISDGVDLGWKIAATRAGWGGPALLASYEQERRAVHEFVMDESVANHALLGHALWQDGLEDAGAEGERLRAQVGARIQAAKLREFNTLGVVLGYQIDHSPLVVGDGTPARLPDFINYVPSARPGALAPHAWLHDGSSLYDHFGAGFTLLASQDAEPAALALAQAAAHARGVPLVTLQPREPAIHALYGARYALIRPDQHVAWRGDTLPRAAEALFARIAGQFDPPSPSPLPAAA